MASKQKKQIRCAENMEAFENKRNEYFSTLKSNPIPKITDENPLSIIYSTKHFMILIYLISD